MFLKSEGEFYGIQVPKMISPNDTNSVSIPANWIALLNSEFVFEDTLLAVEFYLATPGNVYIGVSLDHLLKESS